MDYLGFPVLDIAPDFTSLRSGVVDDSTFAGERGVGTPWKPTDGPRRTVSYPFSLTSKADIAEFRRFIAARYGRLGAFWLPVYLLDYKITSITGTEVIIEHIGLADAVTDFGQFQHIVFYSEAGSLLQIAQIDSISSDGTEETITLTAELDTEIEPDETLCGGAMMARCFADSHEYHFRGLEFATVDVRFIELPREYPSGDGGGEDPELDNPIIDDGDGGTTPPGVGGTVETFESEYVWFFDASLDPNVVIDAGLIAIYKQLFLNERELFEADNPGTEVWGEWYWQRVSTSGTFKSALHKTGFPSVDPESTDGDVLTFTSVGFWNLAQKYRI